MSLHEKDITKLLKFYWIMEQILMIQEKFYFIFGGLLKKTFLKNQFLSNLKDGETLLSIAVKNGAQEVVQVLSDRGAKVNALTKVHIIIIFFEIIIFWLKLKVLFLFFHLLIHFLYFSRTEKLLFILPLHMETLKLVKFS